jgi:hypothetical protein
MQQQLGQQVVVPLPHQMPRRRLLLRPPMLQIEQQKSEYILLNIHQWTQLNHFSALWWLVLVLVPEGFAELEWSSTEIALDQWCLHRQFRKISSCNVKLCCKANHGKSLFGNYNGPIWMWMKQLTIYYHEMTTKLMICTINIWHPSQGFFLKSNNKLNDKVEINFLNKKFYRQFAGDNIDESSEAYLHEELLSLLDAGLRDTGSAAAAALLDNESIYSTGDGYEYLISRDLARRRGEGSFKHFWLE